MYDQPWLDAFGGQLHGAGPAIAPGEPGHVPEGPIPSFGGGLDIAVNVPTVVAGNGVGNVIGGDVSAIGDQHVGDYSYHTNVPFVGELNIGVNAATVVAGNGVGNFIGGDVTGLADQHVGGHAFLPHF